MSIYYPLVASLASVLAVVAGIYFIRQGRRSSAAEHAFFSRGTPVTGTTVDLVRVDSVGSDTHQSHWFHPTVEFTTHDGQVIRATSKNGSRPAPFKLGQATPLVYDPADPHQFMVVSPRVRPGAAGEMNAIMGVFFVLFGLVCGLVSLLIWWIWSSLP